MNLDALRRSLPDLGPRYLTGIPGGPTCYSRGSVRVGSISEVRLTVDSQVGRDFPCPLSIVCVQGRISTHAPIPDRYLHVFIFNTHVV